MFTTYITNIYSNYVNIFSFLHVPLTQNLNNMIDRKKIKINIDMANNNDAKQNEDSTIVFRNNYEIHKTLIHQTKNA